MKSSQVNQPSLVIAIDGPAASGKGTLGRMISQRYKIPYLDTGKLYRYLAFLANEKGVDPDDRAGIARIVKSIKFKDLNRIDLSSEQIGTLAANYAPYKSVRDPLLIFQRKFASSDFGAVLDGRDIGTVVCPDAQVKLYVTASPQERARRRHAELAEKGSALTREEILADIEKRDERDMSRADSPLKPAADAHLIDTSAMDIEAAFSRALEIVETAKDG